MENNEETPSYLTDIGDQEPAGYVKLRRAVSLPPPRPKNKLRHQVELLLADENAVIAYLELTAKEIMGMMGCSFDQAWVLMIVYGWSLEKVNYQFEKASKKVASLSYMEKQGQIAVTGECPVCSKTKEYFFEMGCQHRICTDCCVNYLSQEVVYSNELITCLHEDCDRLFSRSCVETLLKQNSGLMRKRKQRLVERWTKENPDAMKCFSGDCPKILYRRHSEIKNTSCDCGVSMCWDCKEMAHEPLSCQQQRRWISCDMDHETLDKVFTNVETWDREQSHVLTWCGDDVFEDECGSIFHISEQHCKDVNSYQPILISAASSIKNSYKIAALVSRENPNLWEYNARREYCQGLFAEIKETFEAMYEKKKGIPRGWRPKHILDEIHEKEQELESMLHLLKGNVQTLQQAIEAQVKLEQNELVEI